MEWERAKNYMLVFFVLLNICLGLLLFLENRRYTMTNEQSRLIRTVLDQNNISLYTIPMRRFPPMRPLNIKGFYYNEEDLLDILFDNPEDVERFDGDGRILFRYENVSMSISNGFIHYIVPVGFSQNSREEFVGLGLAPDEISFDYAEALTNEFIDAHFPTFVQDDYFRASRGIRITYRQMYRGRFVHSNFIQFLVTPNGIQEIEMRFGEIVGHAVTAEMIFSPDEVLLTFVQRVRHISLESPMTIVNMDLVYHQVYYSDQPNYYHAVPFYRIFINGSDRPFLINAFTNDVID